MLAAGLAVGLVHAAAGGPQAGARPVALHRYVVRPGDTLWAIAQRIAGPTGDARPVVDEIESVNDLSGMIVPGQVLQLP